MFGSLFARLNEPSTHAGIGVAVTSAATLAVQMGANPTKVGMVSTLLSGIFGLFAIFAPEKSGA